VALIIGSNDDEASVLLALGLPPGARWSTPS
jgi:hypothetical protein